MAVNDVSFSINAGETLGLMGPNGAGKTTLVNLITGKYLADSGDVQFMGHDITRMAPYKRCKLGISRTYQIPRPFPELTALMSVAVSALYGKDRVNQGLEDAATEATHYLEFCGLFSKRNVLGKDLTLYELRGLELARALATTPKLIFVDEVMAGLNPGEADEGGQAAGTCQRGIWGHHIVDRTCNGGFDEGSAEGRCAALRQEDSRGSAAGHCQ